MFGISSWQNISAYKTFRRTKILGGKNFSAASQIFGNFVRRNFVQWDNFTISHSSYFGDDGYISFPKIWSYEYWQRTKLIL